MSKNLFSLVLLAFLLGLFAEKINAQASGVKPELFMYRHNGSTSISPLPAITGNTLGTIQWRGLTAINSVLNGATIKSVATNISPGVLNANLLFATNGPSGLTDHMILTPEGRVGIGTLTPSAIIPNLDFRLHVAGNTHTTGDFYGRIHFDQSFLNGMTVVNNVINNFPPSDYVDEAYFELKDRAILTSPGAVLPGLSVPTGANAQGGLLSLGPGGTSLDHQLFFGDEGIFTRRKIGNANNWNSAGWYKLLTSEDISGNVGRIPVFFGTTLGDPSSALRNSQLFDNGTNIAIGGAHPAFPPPLALFNPDYRLTVNRLATGAAMFVDGRAYVNDNMGIGTAPTLGNRLEVSGNSHFDNGNMGIGNAVPTDFRLEVTGNCRFNDRVMINTGDPIHPGALQHQLYVQGSILAEEVKVELVGTWPDYVFAEDYELKPLSEIEKFVKENKHLPGIPSAAEVAENGLSLGETQKVQMEKIEELYLHMIAMEKRMNALEAENAALKAELKSSKH